MLHCLRVLVNPPGRVARGVQLDMTAVTEAAAANPTVRKLLDMFGEIGVFDLLTNRLIDWF